jgi:uncharacterized peroxidase-related enzyme
VSFLQTPAEGPLHEAELASQGYVANYTKLFSMRPEVYAAWQQLNVAIKQGMELRRYELATLAAAKELKSSYCSLAHGKVLRDKFYAAEEVEAIAADPAQSGLDSADVALMAFAEKVARDATSVTQADIDGLREHGLSDPDIFQVVLATAARCFFSTVLDAAGTLPDAQYTESIEPRLRETLTVGRPIAGD